MRNQNLTALDLETAGGICRDNTGISSLSPQGVRRLLALIFLSAIVVDFFFFSGFYASDDREYYLNALSVFQSFTLSSEGTYGRARLAVLAWTLLFGWLSHFDVQVMCASFVLLHLSLIYLTYRLAARVQSPLAGLIAGYTTAMFPLFVICSTCIFPDFLIANGLVLSLLAFLKAYELRERGAVVRPSWYMLLCGLSVGLAYLAKEPGLLGLPFYFFAWLLSEGRLRRRASAALAASRAGDADAKASTSAQDSLAQVAAARAQGGSAADVPSHAGRFAPSAPANVITHSILRGIVTGFFFALGFFIVFGAEYKFLIVITKDPNYFRMGWTSKKEDLSKALNFKNDGGFDPIARFHASMKELGPNSFPDLLKACFLAGLLAYPFVRNRKWTILLFGLWLYGFLTWGSYSLNHYYPPRLQWRYYVPAFPFIIAAFSITLAAVLEQTIMRWGTGRLGRTIRWCAALTIALSPLTYLRGPNSVAGRLYRTHMVRNAARAVQEAAEQNSPMMVLSDFMSDRLSPLWTRTRHGKVVRERPNSLVMCDEMPDVNWAVLFRKPAFHYLEMPKIPKPMSVQLPVDSFDRLLHPAINNDFVNRQTPRVPVRDRGRNLVKAEFFASVDRNGMGIVRLKGRELHPVVQTLFDRTYRTRTRELIHRLTNSLETGDRFFERSFSMPMYRVDVVKAALSPGVQRSLLAGSGDDAALQSDDGTRPQSVGDAATQLTGAVSPIETPLRWRLLDENSAVLDRNRNGSLVLTLKDEFAMPIVLEPERTGVLQDALKLTRHRRFRLRVDVEMSPKATAELVFRAMDAADVSATTTVESLIPLVDGRNEISFHTSDEERFWRPAFRFVGGGRIVIRRILLSEFEPIYP